jgi:hypothetical protein
MARPKQQHYVTKAYLDGFLTPGSNQLVCYARNGKTFPRGTRDLSASSVRLLLHGFPYALSTNERLRSWFDANPGSF